MTNRNLRRIEIYALEDAQGNESGVYGPWGYDNNVQAYKAAKAEAMTHRLRVVAYKFTFYDSDLIDDFTADAAEEEEE